MLDIQIIKDKKQKYYRNGIHNTQVVEFLREVYTKLADPDKIYIQIYDMNEMPCGDIEGKGIWDTLDKFYEFYAEVETQNERDIINEKINDEIREQGQGDM